MSTKTQLYRGLFEGDRSRVIGNRCKTNQKKTLLSVNLGVSLAYHAGFYRSTAIYNVEYQFFMFSSVKVLKQDYSDSMRD